MLLLYTIGYEGSTIEEWTEMIRTTKMTCVVDTREFPISRKPGFSKRTLSNRLESFGIRYIHYKRLGSPKSIRHQLRRTGDYDEFFDAYEQYLKTCEHELLELAHLAIKETLGILCFERDHRRCHREIVARRLIEIVPQEVRVIHVDCVTGLE